jgi:hypothetical protein
MRPAQNTQSGGSVDGSSLERSGWEWWLPAPRAFSLARLRTPNGPSRDGL